MLSKKENDLLTRVGPRTPMGEVMRRYWLPALLAEEIPAPDCPPVRVRLLGEDLIGFRDSQGKLACLLNTVRTAARRYSSDATRTAACGVFIMAGSMTWTAMFSRLPRNPQAVSSEKSCATSPTRARKSPA